MNYLEISLAILAIISLGMLIFVLTFIIRLRESLEATEAWMRSGVSEIDRLTKRLEGLASKAAQSGEIKKPNASEP